MNRSEAGKLGAMAVKDKQHNEKLERIKQYDSDPKICRACLKSLDYGRRHNQFCSHSCSASFNNLGSAKNPMLPRPYCLECGEKLSRHKLKFCSNRHFQAYRWKQAIKKWLSGEANVEVSGGLTVSSAVKRWIRERDGNKCVICNGSVWMGAPMPLMLDHKDGNPLNNSSENLRSVCGNCNMLLPTFTGRNRGRGRSARKIWSLKLTKAFATQA